jgi:hypothetical protein
MNKGLLVACLCLVVAACSKSEEQSPSPSTPKAVATETTAKVASGGEIALVPGTSFGPIRLGESKADIEAAGLLRVHPQYSGMTIPYTVYYDNAGHAKRIQLSLQFAPADVDVGGTIIPRTATFEGVKSLLGDCKDQPPAIGGTTSKCRGGAVNVSIGSGSPHEVWIEAA